VKGTKDEVIELGRTLTEEFSDYSRTAMQKLRPIMSHLELRDQIMRGNEANPNRKVQIPEDYTTLQEQLTTHVLAYVKKLHKVWYIMVTAEVELNEQILEVGQELERSTIKKNLTSVREITERDVFPDPFVST